MTIVWFSRIIVPCSYCKAPAGSPCVIVHSGQVYDDYVHIDRWRAALEAVSGLGAIT